MLTLIQRIRKREFSGLPLLADVIQMQRNDRLRALTAYGGNAGSFEREVYNRVLVLLWMLHVPQEMQVQHCWTQKAQYKYMRDNSAGFKAIERELSAINKSQFIEFLGEYSPCNQGVWFEDGNVWLRVSEASFDFMALWSLQRPCLQCLSSRVSPMGLKLYLQQYYAEMQDTKPEFCDKFRRVYGFALEIPEGSADELAGSAEVDAVLRKHMGEWDDNEFWKELTELYDSSKSRYDLKTMKEILFLKAKVLGLMKDGNGGTNINVFAVMDTKATDALKSLGFCQSKKLEVVSEQ